MEHSRLGQSNLLVPRIVYGTSCLGNLYQALPDETKLAISRAWFACQRAPVVIDCAGKYGAGLALEVIGRNLRTLGVAPDDVVISNKLGWQRVPLTTSEPTFEPGVWAGLRHDAQQSISYDGILKCWEQGCELLGGDYQPQLLSVHDPDEYLRGAKTPGERRERFGQIVAAYEALAELKQQGLAEAVGVGAKDWQVIREVAAAVDLDWIMLANSMTIYRHPPELLDFISAAFDRGVGVINSAVFHAGFLLGGAYFDYRQLSPGNVADQPVFAWRDAFLEVCREYSVEPAAACIQFALSPPGVCAVALNTSDPDRIAENVAAANRQIPGDFWRKLQSVGLVAQGSMV